MAFSLVYVSEIAPSLQSDADSQRAALLAIENHARKRNPAVGVRGLLVFVAGYFIQWLEGEEAAVRLLMQRIATDPRHCQLQVVYQGSGAVKLNEWSMSLATRADKDNAIALLISQLRAGQMPEPVTGSVPADIFQGLLAPRELPQTEAQANLQANKQADVPTKPAQKRNQIALLGQTGLWSAAVVTYLSDLWKVPVQRTRLIGSQGFEREALLEYVDAVHPVLGPVRVMNCSGNVLQLPWIRSLLENVQTHALFYSVNQMEAALEFTETAMRQLPEFAKDSVKPTMACLFGRTARLLMAPTQSWFEARGLPVHAVSMSLADVAAVWQTVESLTVDRHLAHAPVVEATANAVAVAVAVAATAPVANAPVASSPVASSSIAKMPVATMPAKVVAAVQATPVAVQAANATFTATAHPLSASVAKAPPLLVSVKSSQPKPPAQAQSQSMPELGSEARQWLEDLLTIRGVQWAGVQIGELTACAHAVCNPDSAATPGDIKVQSQHFKNRLAQESRLHKMMRLRVEIGESIQMVTRYANAFEVSLNLPAPNGPVVVVLQSMPGSADLAIVLSSLEKRLQEPLPVFYAFTKAVKAA